MLCRTVAVAAMVGASALAALTWTGSARAESDTIRLGLNTSAPTLTLEGGQDAETTEVWRRYSYYAPRYAYGYSYYTPGFSYGYSSFYPRYSYSYSYGYSYFPRYSYGYSSYYYYPRTYSYSYYYPRPYFYYGISLDGSCGSTPTVTLGNPVLPTTPEVRPQPAPAAPPVQKDGTFPYDGGPERPVPMPKVEDPATRIPRQTTPMIEGIPVSMPAKVKYVYPAYGETIRR